MTLLFWLTLTILVTAALWVPYILNRFLVVGIFRSLETPSDDWPVAPAWAQRAKAAHQNAVENLVLFAPLAILVQLTVSDPSVLTTAATAAAVYFFARLAHFVIYTLSIPYLRTVAFLVGFGTQVFLGYLLLTGAGHG